MITLTVVLGVLLFFVLILFIGLLLGGVTGLGLVLDVFVLIAFVSLIVKMFIGR